MNSAIHILILIDYLRTYQVVRTKNKIKKIMKKDKTISTNNKQLRNAVFTVNNYS
jgi:hypothetical protein